MRQIVDGQVVELRAVQTDLEADAYAPWKARHEQRLIAAARNREPIEAVAKELGRTVRAVRARAYRLRLRFPGQSRPAALAPLPVTIYLTDSEQRKLFDIAKSQEKSTPALIAEMVRDALE